MADGRARTGAHEFEVAIAFGMLGIAGLGIGGVLLARGVLLASRYHFGAKLALAGHAIVAALAAIVVLALLGLVLRGLSIRRTLHSRVAYAVLPPPAFDPKSEAIEIFGQQLLGARRRILAWLDAPACAIRIRIITTTTTTSGRVVYVIELPARFRGSVFNAYAAAFPGVQLTPLAEMERLEGRAA